MPARLVALDEGPDIPLDRTMVVVGRHPQCDARLDSLRVSRHHCCMTQDHGEVIVRDLGSTNGIRINGQRVEFGRLRPGDELSIAHIRYRLDASVGHEATVADSGPIRDAEQNLDRSPVDGAVALSLVNGLGNENRLAAAVREMLPSALVDRYRIQVIVKMTEDTAASEESAAETPDECPPDSSP